MGVLVAASRLLNQQNDVLNCTERSQREMYATRMMTEIYHLVQPGGQHTLCGLRISRITLERKTNTLQLVNALTPNLTICKHCERIEKQDSFGI
jgi:hypothetical protein